MASTAVLALLACVLAVTASGSNVSKPNIILVVGDDMGWANAGWHNPGNVVTPNMDALVRSEAIELDRHYVFFYCSPTRSSLMSGRLPMHVTENNNYACTVQGAAPVNMTLLPAKLKTVGYKTHHIGKWHLGQAKQESIPINRGFDTDFGYLGGAEDHYTNKNGGCGNCGSHVDLWRNHGPAVGESDKGFMAYKYNAEAIKIIKSHDQSSPLFMYLAAQCAHAPNQPDAFANLYSSSNYTQDFIDYNGMISAVDSIVGNVTAALKETGMWENTLFLFTSDNGGPAAKSVSGSAANNYPLRGGKHTAWDGGHRVIAFVSGGLVPQHQRGTKLEGYIHIADWYATFAHLAGFDPTDNAPGMPGVDGINQWHYLTGSVADSPRTEVPLASFMSDHAKGIKSEYGSAALIVGDYKLIRFPQQYCFWQGPVYPNATTDHKHDIPCDVPESGWLFNIKTDPGEHHNLASDPAHSDVYKKILARAEELDKTAIEYIKPQGWRGQLDASAYCDQMRKNGGIWGPDLP
eukprot:m.92254 g.92254  ORF g.92254 m.92254 type:complete len:519 (-) comp15063_c0_seq2:211-1767(-)